MAAGLDPTVTTAVLAALEAALNRALELDPVARRSLARLAGRTFAIECTEPAVAVYLQPGSDRVRLLGFHDGTVTTRVTGTARDFVELASSSDPAATLINGNLAQLEEFIHEEARLSPPRLEVEDFYADVQALGQRVERLQSRLARLRKRIAQATS